MLSCKINENTQCLRETQHNTDVIQNGLFDYLFILEITPLIFRLTLVGVNSDGAECFPHDGPTYIGHYEEGYLSA